MRARPAVLSSLMGLALCLSAAASPEPLAAQKDPTQDPATVDQLARAFTLAGEGRQQRDPAALMEAARIMLTLQRRGVKTHDLRFMPDARALLQDARGLVEGREDDAHLRSDLDMLEEIAATSSRGLMSTYALNFRDAVARRGRPWLESFDASAGVKVNLLVFVERPADLDFTVLDDRNKEVCRISGRSFTLRCAFTPDRDGRFKARISSASTTPTIFHVRG